MLHQGLPAECDATDAENVKGLEHAKSMMQYEFLF